MATYDFIPILNVPIEQTSLTHSLKILLVERGFQNVGELIQHCRVYQLMMIKGFSYHHLLEVYRILEEYGCEGMLKE